ncbi:MAG: hypothetical protein US62_C0006G0002 [Candidatus Woesebacteria bacterium GW2011_GWA1_37_8]|uniref:Uncharacterized protein n=1 Tax=Candidatus Woesebacteria bacterium GW2011_GWA1_37_8 TaxID=1618546 RepID=A0A0G0KZR4_9BACT|nr:MAG: hypothetical protein US39_C0004G0025 [Microgenomates group bacterium GW2011_GWC1_37_12b]KKQ45991.1 MAG: hypothetical protein US62_C0006G0002 [Candidatus Woesebacteria bacterium GW2011_GWA1_37_8]
MNAIKFIFLSAVIFTFFLFQIPVAKASEVNQYITIVNPVRESHYTQNLYQNLETQYRIISDRNLPATWLLTYDVIEKEDETRLLKSFNGNQELGIFLEVTLNFSEKAGVKYNKGGSWHSANSVFLSGYLQSDREKLIDTVFEKFKKIFGYYPASIGSWWTDSYSLSYMKNKYGITANLVCADQFSTDGYQIWGQYWSAPYYPSRFHAGIPASNDESKLDIVNVQWAARDPLNGYYNSLYSVQDYMVGPVNKDLTYIEKLIEIYAGTNDNQIGHIVIGLESDLTPDAYQKEYKDRIELVSELSGKGVYQVVSMKDFSSVYRNIYPGLSPEIQFVSDDILGKKQKVFWYQSPFYRIGLLYDIEKSETKVFDLRIYSDKIIEPYYLNTNREFDLSIYIPSLLDEVNNEDDVWITKMGKLVGRELKEDFLTLNFEKGSISLGRNNIRIIGVEKEDIPVTILKSKATDIKISESEISVSFNGTYPFSRDGTAYRDLSAEATHRLKTKKVGAIIIAIVITIIFFGYLLLKKKQPLIAKIIYIFSITLIITGSFIWLKDNRQNYLIDQSEMEMLWRLSTLPQGNVMVYDNECLQCEYFTKYKPPAFSNKRDYVKYFGKHRIVYNSSVINSIDRETAKKEFDKLNVDYVYLVKYGDYIEKLPFSPGDIGVAKLYDNPYTEIWKKVK